MYQKILVPLDGSQTAECVLPHVEAFIKGAFVKTVLFLRVVKPLPLIIYGDSLETFSPSAHIDSFTAKPEYWEKMEEERNSAAIEYLHQATDRFKQYDVEIRCEVLQGNVAETIANYAEKNTVDLIIIATHGRSGVTRWLMGSVADRIIQSSSIPVLMIRAPGEPECKKD